MEQKERLYYLFQRAQDRSITPAECNELLGMISSDEQGATIHTLSSWHLDFIRSHASHRPAASIDWKLAAREVLDVVRDHQKPVHFLRRSWLKYAAAIIIIAGVGAYLWNTNRNSERILVSTHKPLQVDIAPGTNRAVLTVDNKQIDLASNKTGITVGTTIAYTDGEKLSETGKMLMLSTPKGGQYQIVLPDGTKVWLNAASSIEFPSAFTEAKRSVEITGEVYMEVAQNSRQPFVVNAAGAEIQVLGTTFNVNAYANENAIKTTLIDGSVKTSANGQSVIIKPGQQSVINNQIKVRTANIEQTLAWKNGIFNFDESDPYTVMRQLERWYDIKVQYQGPISDDLIFKGKMYRSIHLSDVLEVLKEMGIKTRLEGRTLIVL